MYNETRFAIHRAAAEHLRHELRPARDAADDFVRASSLAISTGSATLLASEPGRSCRRVANPCRERPCTKTVFREEVPGDLPHLPLQGYNLTHEQPIPHKAAENELHGANLHDDKLGGASETKHGDQSLCQRGHTGR